MNERPKDIFDYLAFLLWMGLFLTLAPEARAQLGPLAPGQRIIAAVNNSPSGEDPADNVFVPPDRRTLQRLSQAKELIAKGRYGEAVQNLGVIIEAPEDFFFQPEKNQPIHRSLKSEAQRLVGQMPREGRELYELEFGAKARLLLAQAVAAGDAQGLAQVSQRFFHTRAGYEATFILGLDHLDHGQPLAGALTLQRLADSANASDQFEPALSLAMAAAWLQAGDPDKARDALMALRRNYPQLVVKTAAGKVPFFTNGDEALDWLTKLVGTGQVVQSAEPDRWLIFQGNPRRNAVAAGSAPLLSLCWQSPATDDPLIEEVMRRIRQGILARGFAVLPGLHPLAVDDVILVRTYKNLQALDFASGKRLWEAPADELQESNTAAGDYDANLQTSLTSALLSHRALSDATFGTLSSDGRLVFAVEDPGPSFNMKSVRRGININNSSAAAISNRLAAYDIRNGKLKWQLGGAADDFAVRLPETFFLGPPLPLMGQLYVLAETKGEVRLLALDAATGNPSWSQQLLAVMDQNVQQSPPIRRTSGISPAYADGILVCPTSTGAVVALELATRSLLWGYRYDHDNRPEHLERMFVPVYGDVGWSAGLTVDAGVSIADGRVLLTPIDSDAVHCLNLGNGELRWKYKHQDEIFLACVHQGKAILAGQHQVRAIRLADGKPDWDGRIISLPEGVTPSGRGYSTGEKYFLPLESAEVAEIDLAQGKIIRNYKSRNGFIPGNLVCYKGRVISQGSQGVDVFYQIDAAEADIQRRLVANPADCDALCLQGEILLDVDRRGQAIDCFRRAYAVNPDPHARQLLRDSLLEGLQREFAAYRGQTAEIETLLDDPSQQAVYFRLMAVGLRRSGDVSGAFEHCEKLMELEPDALPLEAVDKSLRVRRDRWIQAQLASLVLEAKGETAEKIEAAIQARYQSAAASGSSESLRRFLAYFGNQPVASRARAELIDKLMQAGRLLEAETSNWESFPASDPAANAPALGKLAEMLREAGQKESAAAAYDWLRPRLNGAVCRDGKTVEQIINDLPADDAVRNMLNRKDPWPVGDVQNAAKDAKNLGTNFGRVAVEFMGLPGPFFENLNLTLDQNRRVLSASDELGNELWKIPLNDDRRQGQPFYAYNPGIAHARALGHLLLLSAGGNLFAVDTLRSGGKNPPKILWSSGIAESSVDAVNAQTILPQAIFAGTVQMRIAHGQGNHLEAVTDRYICLLRSRSLYALDPLTGSTLWVRQDIPMSSTVFGDEEYVFVLPPDKSEAIVLRALDGETAGTRKIGFRKEITYGYAGGQTVKGYTPLNESCPLILGRNLLFWRSEENRRVLELFDPWTQKSVWPSRQFSNRAQYSILGNELIGVMEPTGEFVLLNLADGRAIAELKLKPDPYLGEIILLAFGDRFLLLSNDIYRDSDASQMSVLQLYGISAKQIHKGRLYSIDRGGKLLWPEPAAIENHYLLTNQSRGLPVLLFMRRSSQRQNSSGRILSILAVDKRTGRTVYDSDLSKPIGFFNALGDAEKKTVSLMMQGQTVTLTFTDNPPRPLEKKAEDANKKPRVNTSKALLNSLEKTMGRMFGLPEEDSFDEEEP